MSYVLALIWLTQFTQEVSAKECTSQLRLSLNKSSLTVHRGDNVTLDCIAGAAASGTAHTFLHWKRERNKILTAAHAVTLPDLHQQNEICDVERLLIYNFTSKDNGKYICTRENSQQGFSPNSVEININMFKPFAPVMKLNVARHIKMLEYEKYNLSCRVSGSPIPVIHWIIENKTVVTCHKKEYCVVEIIALRNETYVCHAYNELGQQNKSVHISVLVPPEVQRSHLGTYGNKLTCTVKRSIPAPHILWQYQDYNCSKDNTHCVPEHLWKNISGSLFKITPAARKVSFVSTLHISASHTNALFRCFAFNEAGNDSDVMRVLLNNSNYKSSGLDRSAIAGIIIAAILPCCFIVFLIFVIRKRMFTNRYARFLSPYSDYQIKVDINLMEQGLHLPYDTAWEYPRNQLEFIKVLGSGAFGQVWLARAVDIQKWNYNPDMVERKRKTSLYDYVKKTNRNNNKMSYHAFVAVKTLKDDATESEYKDLASEIKVLIHIGKHKCIVNLLGACTRDGSLFSIMEYCPFGDLKNFLKSKRQCFVPEWSISLHDNICDSFTFGDAATMVFQIAKGMEFLHSKKLIHRDLACRNILLGEQYCVKISDFGLARDIYEDDNYVKTTTGLLPVKWMSPESLFDKIYNTKTDVWSFSIVLWEIFTLGGSPYPGIPVEDLFAYISRGHRMSQPDSCPDPMYEIMMQCWKQESKYRPNFTEIVAMVENVLKTNVGSNPYLQLVAEDDSLSGLESYPKISTPDSNSKRAKKFSFVGLIGGFMSSKRSRPVSAEDQLLSRLSSTNSDVFERA